VKYGIALLFAAQLLGCTTSGIATSLGTGAVGSTSGAAASSTGGGTTGSGTGGGESSSGGRSSSSSGSGTAGGASTGRASSGGASGTGSTGRASGGASGGASGSASTSGGSTGRASSSGGGSSTGGRASSTGGEGGSSGAGASSTGGGSSSGGAIDLCGAPSGSLAWTGSIPVTQSSLALVDIEAGPTDDVVVADQAGPAEFEQHRWSSAGALLGVHQDTSGAFNGPMSTTGLFIDPSNDAFYGLLLTETQGSNTEAELEINSVSPSGTLRFSQTTTGTLPTSGGAPSIVYFAAGGDSGGGLHAPFLMGNPQYIPPGVYCYGSGGSFSGISGTSAVDMLSANDFMWVTQANDLAMLKPLTATTDLGCGSLTVPAGGAVALALFNTGGGCTWSKLLTLPTAAVQGETFRLGADGSMLLAVVYAGTIDFGGGSLTSTGTSSLAAARFDGSGNLLWAQSFGGSGSSFTIGSIGGNAAGDVILSAGYAGTVNLGGGALPASDDTLLALFDGTGTLQWSRTVTVGAQGTLQAAAGSCGLVLATNSTSVDLGTGPLSTLTGGVASIGVAALGL